MSAGSSNSAYVKDNDDISQSSRSAKYNVAGSGEAQVRCLGDGCKVFLIVVIIILLIILTGLVTAIVTWKVTSDHYIESIGNQKETTTTTTALPSSATSTTTTGPKRRLNVLHIISDDHRPELGSYLQYRPETYRFIRTPNLDAFADTGTKFTNAFANSPECNPSRASFLTSRRPETTGIIDVADLPVYFRTRCNVTTLPGYLRSIGYETRGAGKVFHSLPWMNATADDNPFSWSQPVYQPPNFADYFQDSNFLPIQSHYIVNNSAITSEDNIVNEAIQMMGELAGMQKDNPFYMAVGFYRPHLPFWAKEKTYHLYQEDVGLPTFSYVTQDEPRKAWLGCAELLQYGDIDQYLLSQGVLNMSMLKNYQVPFNYTLPNPTITSLRRAYYTAISEMDQQIGQLLQTLKDQGLDDNTIVIYQADHGYLLGEHGGWTKFQASDLVNRVPLIIRVPGMRQNRVVSSLVELVDLFPTLVELLGLPSLQTCPQDKSSSVQLCTEGMSFKNLIDKDAKSASTTDTKLGQDESSWNKPAFTKFYFTLGNNPPFMFYTVRDEQYRYVRYMNYTAGTQEIRWDEVLGEMLFDYNVDPYENINFIHDPMYAQIKVQLAGLLADGWQKYIH